LEPTQLRFGAPPAEHVYFSAHHHDSGGWRLTIHAMGGGEIVYHVGYEELTWSELLDVVIAETEAMQGKVGPKPDQTRLEFVAGGSLLA
jgi:hypothetical protein